jgi:hypothetical protein
MSKELASISQRIERLRRILRLAIRVHKILTELSEFQSESKHGRFLANDHRMMIRAYSKFFEPVETSLYLDLHLQVAKVLIDHEGALHIPKLMRQLDAEGRKIVRDAANNPTFEEEISGFGVWYELLPKEELNDLSYMLKNKRDLIKRLEYARNKRLAHEDLSEVSIELLSLHELMELINLAKTIINKIESTYGGFNDVSESELDRTGSDTVALLNELYKDY